MRSTLVLIALISFATFAAGQTDALTSEDPHSPASGIAYFQTAKDILEAAAYFVGILGIPFGLLLLWRDSRREKVERDLQANIHSHEIYCHYLSCCLENTHADAFEITEEELAAAEMSRETAIVYLHLISMMQTAFNLYIDQHKRYRHIQRKGWEIYIAMWAENPRFQRAWMILGEYWDKKFQDCVNTYINRQTD